MQEFADYLAKIENPRHRERTAALLAWVAEEYPELEPRIAWNQPMFTYHGTFIIGLSVAGKHLAIAPEKAGIQHFSRDILQSGYDHSQQLIRIPWDHAVDYSLLKRIVDYNIKDKAGCKTFWRG